MTNNSDILFEKIPGVSGDVNLVTLNRPQALNALSHEMILALHKQLAQWKTDSKIKAVIIQGAGEKAFCAGGDIRKIYDARNDPTLSIKQFFWDEYRLNTFIHHYPKPYISLLNGITMGGGVGVSLHGSHRVATEKFSFAMPETGIGFFPDIGGSYFLARCPGQTGTYLGLTGARVKAADGLYLKLVNQFVSSEKLSALISTLVETEFGSDAHKTVTQVIEKFSSDAGTPALKEHQNIIDHCFDKNTVEEILASLEKNENSWCQEVAKTLQTKSPSSLKITLEQLRKGAKLDFDQCMQMEYRMVIRFLKGNDFYEGVRAVIVDKDQKPQWQPATLKEVTQKDVEHYFAPLVDIPELNFS